MKKEAPERRVLLKKEDVFYVYDKRINKCVRHECEGIVKYGLVLKVTVSNGQTINSFECNKCHMKYTPYANYVRLENTEEITIYNQEDIIQRDKKRERDAKKYKCVEQEKNDTYKAYNPKKSYKKSYQKGYYSSASGYKKAQGSKKSNGGYTNNRFGNGVKFSREKNSYE